MKIKLIPNVFLTYFNFTSCFKFYYHYNLRFTIREHMLHTFLLWHHAFLTFLSHRLSWKIVTQKSFCLTWSENKMVSDTERSSWVKSGDFEALSSGWARPHPCSASPVCGLKTTSPKQPQDSKIIQVWCSTIH